MPSFSNHIIFNMAVLTLFLIYLQEHPIITIIQTFIFCIGYFIGSVILTPDMDTKSDASNRCGILCVPYRKIFKHRGISHHAFWGIFTRIGYAILIIIIIAGVFGFFTIETWQAALGMIVAYKIELLVFIGGLFFSNLFHVVLDRIT